MADRRFHHELSPADIDIDYFEASTIAWATTPQRAGPRPRRGESRSGSGRGGLVALPMGDSSALRPGQAVVALGDPLTSPWSFATATVSATRRDVVATSGATMEAAMLTDASLGSGESGGPLIDMNGRVVAVIDRVGATAGDPRSAGSAVPINLAAHVIADSQGR